MITDLLDLPIPATDQQFAARQQRYDALQTRTGIEWQAERVFLKRLGFGGQGSVMLAERRGAGCFRVPVALKFFSPSPFESILRYDQEMVKRTGQVKIIDIGSAYWIGRPPDGQPCTLEYAAPEVLAGFRATPQSDLASLGYMLIEMLSGSRPFSGLTWEQLIQAKQDVLERLPALLPLEEFQFSESLIRLLRRLLHPDPRQRFPTAEDAELSDEGAAGFLRELVKSDMSDEYATELRRWIAELETDGVERHDPHSDSIPDGTTRLVDLQRIGELGSDPLTNGLSGDGFDYVPG